MSTFARFMTDAITIKRELSVDVNGDTTYGTAIPAKCRHEKVTKFVAGPNGNKIQIDDSIATETEIRTTDRVWLPGDDLSAVGRKPKTVKYAARPRGAGHYEASF